MFLTFVQSWQGQDGQQYVVLEVVQYPDGEEGGEPVPVAEPTPVRQAPPPAPGPSSINVKQELKDSFLRVLDLLQ